MRVHTLSLLVSVLAVATGQVYVAQQTDIIAEESRLVAVNLGTTTQAAQNTQGQDEQGQGGRRPPRPSPPPVSRVSPPPPSRISPPPPNKVSPPPPASSPRKAPAPAPSTRPSSGPIPSAPKASPPKAPAPKVAPAPGPAAPVGPASKRITYFPGLVDPIVEQFYGGYININGTSKFMYYLLATSQRDPANDPLVVWVNGGPGDSSFIGFGQEHGPFHFSLVFNDPNNETLIPDNVTLTRNPYAWNQVANILYIDNPVGSGLSYSLDEADYNTTDSQEQIDLEQTVRQWFQEYPYFQNHDVFYNGESYGGQYITMLTYRTILRNQQGVKPYINLMGYMIGNAVTADQLDNVDLFQIYTFLSLIPLELNQQIVENNCNIGATAGPSYSTNALSADYQTFKYNVSVCTALFEQILSITYNLYGYNLIYEPFYAEGTFEVSLYNQIKAQLIAQGYNYQEPYYGADSNSARTDDRAVTWWVNQRNVRTAIHAGQIESPTGFFYISTFRLTYNYDIFDIIPLHTSNIANGVRALVYSGDHDGVLGVPWPGSQTWTTILGEKLGMKEGGNWTTWYKADPYNYGDQTAGYITQYNGLTYMTVRGAGHQVPIYRPVEALIMFSNFLTDTLNDTTMPIVGTLDIPATI